MLRILRYLVFAFLIIASLSACVTMNDPEGTQDYKNDIVSVIEKSDIIGQSFVSRHPRLNGLTLWLSANSEQDAIQGNGHAIINLYHLPNDNYSLYTTSIAISPSWDMSPIEIPIPPQEDNPGQSYYVTLETTGLPIKVHGRSEDAYIAGSTTINGSELFADLAFRMSYEYEAQSFINDLLSWATNARYLIPLIVTIFFPGWVILELSDIRRNYSVCEQFALSLGLSLAFFPLLFLWSSVFKLPLSRNSILGILGFLTIAIILRFAIRKLRLIKSGDIRQLIHVNLNDLLHSREIAIFITLTIIIMGSFMVRLAMVRDLATPPWVDSVHHAMITRLIMLEGGLPSSYTPYMEFDIYNYHTGFHSGLAVFTWLSELELPDALLIYGQALNALATLSVFLFTRFFTGRPWAGLLAAMITGFLTPMPAYYTSWGRYTQLAGLLILPAVAVFLAQVINQSNIKEKAKKTTNTIVLLGAIAISGLFLVHYRVVAFVTFFLFAYFLTGLPRQKKHLFHHLSRFTALFIFCGLLILCLVLPWFLPAAKQVFIPKLNPSSITDVNLFSDFSWRFLTAALGKQSLILGGLGLIISSILMPRISITILLWITQLLFFSNLDALKLPGSGFITGTSVAIMLFIPISMMGGFFLDEIISSWEKILSWNHRLRGRVTLIIIASSMLTYSMLMGARNLIPIINPMTILSRQADRVALNWITENISQESTFIINPFPWGFGLYSGNDGGYWISPTTGAITTPPPALYGLGNLDYVENINKISQNVIASASDPQEIWKLMKNNNIEYIYIGVKGGELSPHALQESELFNQIYNREGVKIFQTISEP